MTHSPKPQIRMLPELALLLCKPLLRGFWGSKMYDFAVIGRQIALLRSAFARHRPLVRLERGLYETWLVDCFCEFEKQIDFSDSKNSTCNGCYESLFGPLRLMSLP